MLLLIGAVCLVVFVGGMIAAWNNRHHTICPDGKPPVAQRGGLLAVASVLGREFEVVALAGVAGLGRDAALALRRRSLDALARMDGESARAVIAEDAQIDDQFNGILRQLITYMMEDPRNILPCTHLLFCAKHIERIGDHATNIAEDVIFIVEARDVRHQGGHHVADHD